MTQRQKIAIVGAGFGGLVAANRLQTVKNTTIEVLEASSPNTTGSYFVGDIHVPCQRHVLSALNLLTDASPGNTVSRQELLKVLQKNVCIQYRQRVERVVSVNNTKQLVLHVTMRDDNTTTTTTTTHKGPYDVVILAHGVGQLPITAKNKNIFSIGDARYTRWWDFGQHRIRQGANRAMLDGLQLANAILCNDTLKQERFRRVQHPFDTYFFAASLVVLVVAVVYGRQLRECVSKR